LRGFVVIVLISGRGLQVSSPSTGVCE